MEMANLPYGAALLAAAFVAEEVFPQAAGVVLRTWTLPARRRLAAEDQTARTNLRRDGVHRSSGSIEDARP
jgi:hypothetical protein